MAATEIICNSTNVTVGQEIDFTSYSPDGGRSTHFGAKVTAVDTAEKTITVRYKSWTGTETATIDDYAHEDRRALCTPTVRH